MMLSGATWANCLIFKTQVLYIFVVVSFRLRLEEQYIRNIIVCINMSRTSCANLGSRYFLMVRYGFRN